MTKKDDAKKDDVVKGAVDARATCVSQGLPEDAAAYIDVKGLNWLGIAQFVAKYGLPLLLKLLGLSTSTDAGEQLTCTTMPTCVSKGVPLATCEKATQFQLNWNWTVIHDLWLRDGAALLDILHTILGLQVTGPVTP